MKNFRLLVFALLLGSLVNAQTTISKFYPKYTPAGVATVLYNTSEYTGSVATKNFVLDFPATNFYSINALANVVAGQKYKVYLDNVGIAYVTPTSGGWQWIVVLGSVKIPAGKHTITFAGPNGVAPMFDEINIGIPTGRQEIPAPVQSFLQKVNVLASEPVNPTKEESLATTPVSASKVLPNPEGEYSHAIDTGFVYSSFTWVYLNPGLYTFTTVNSTVSRALAVFKSGDYSTSSSNVNGGVGGESYVSMYVPTAAYYGVLVRPSTSGASGITDILMNGTLIVDNAVVGGKYYAMPTLRGGDMNFFTCKISGDTRIFVSRYPSSSIRDYNDDYAGTGSWSWSVASRVKKTYNGSDSVQYTYVCAYSPTSTGICDIYMGCGNSNLHQLEPTHFPLLYDDDAIRSAPLNGTYNCISWTGGITTGWSWPPSWLSNYNCTSANLLQCFDNFYNNVPVRYPGAWNYSRTGATEANSIVDLWKTATDYTHASVKEPGNNHPHGYDWESKPGGLNRTFHPRYALTMSTWYGSVSNYYKATGTYARNGAEQHYATDMDAVKAGVAVIDQASLTQDANDKLNRMLSKSSTSLQRSFETLYEKWDATKAANASQSNPDLYCQNREFKALEAFALANRGTAMLITFDKFIKGDHLIGNLLKTLTFDKYGKLIDEVKQERLANPNDKQGRYRITNDHDNGVWYIEKILKLLPEEGLIETVPDAMVVTVSPNPVRDRVAVQFSLDKPATVSVAIVSGQTGAKKVLQNETVLSAGTHRYESFVKDIAGGNGNMLAVQVTINGVVKTTKVMVMQ